MSDTPYRPAPDPDAGRTHKTVEYVFSITDPDRHTRFIEEMYSRGWEVVGTSIYNSGTYDYYIVVTYKRRTA